MMVSIQNLKPWFDVLFPSKLFASLLFATKPQQLGRSAMRLRLSRDVSGIKANTSTDLAVLTNQRSYLMHDTCDGLNNITARTAPLHAHTHMVFLIGSLSPLSLSLPHSCNLSLSNLPTLHCFPIQRSPLTPPLLSSPGRAPCSPPSVMQNSAVAAEFPARGHWKQLAGGLKERGKK